MYIYLKLSKNTFYILNRVVALLIPVDFNIGESRWISCASPCNIFKDLFTFGSCFALMRKMLCSYSSELTEKIKHCYGIITLTWKSSFCLETPKLKISFLPLSFYFLNCMFTCLTLLGLVSVGCSQRNLSL